MGGGVFERQGGLGAHIVAALVKLVSDGVLGCGGAGGDGSVVVLCNLLVCLLACRGGGPLHGFGDVVGSVPKRRILLAA